MTPGILNWIKSIRPLIGRPNKIIEVGSLNVNGSPRELFRDVRDYTGVDMCKGNGVDIIADASNLPFEDRCTDFVICCETLEHTKDPLAVAAELKRILKHDGYLLISSPANGFHIHRYPRDYWRLMPDAYEDLIFSGMSIISQIILKEKISCYLGKK